MNERTLGETVRELREAQNLSLTALAERAQISIGFLTMIEAGHGGRPPLAILGRLARALGVSVKALETNV